ncbi:Wzz/FepE/Etk N-terminal domain-containing protein [Neptuniibacter sp. QD37_6]|uniref:Wzz/FepE/Etk N-terminal domain-containing protein n=1 Tax=Neptuniibacter sp. QD37_6 TaxID=3398210 RepID=UPI0039F52D7A
MSTSNPPQHNDEINLLQLMETLWKERRFILIITLVFTLLGIGFALTTPSVYQASTHLVQLSPENQKKLEQLSLYSSITPITPLDEYLQLLNSNEIKEAFIREASTETSKTLYSAEDDTINITTLSSNLNIENNQTNKKKQAIFPYTINFNSHSRTLAEQELNRFLTFTASKLKETYLRRHQKLHKFSLSQLQKTYEFESNEAATLRKSKIIQLEEAFKLAQKETQLQLHVAINAEKARHQDSIESLSNALSTATALQIIEPISLSKMGAKKANISVDLHSNKDPIYLRGTKLLTAELEQLKNNARGYKRNNEIIKLEGEITKLGVNHKIEQLKNRKDDLAFNTKLQSLKAEIDKLTSEEFPNIELNFAHTKAKGNPNRIKPKRKLIVLLTTIMGGIVGIIAALVRSTTRNRKTN